jgi:16S rRNA (guanine(1405)-N(7))-methyltransferase
LVAAKYRPLAPQLVQAIAASEAPKARSADEAVKRVKRKLHQMVGAYLDSDMPYAKWLDWIGAARNEAERREACVRIMRHHASSRERINDISTFYQALFSGLPPPRVVADLACGLNPLARAFMPLPQDTVLECYDVHADLVNFVLAALRLMEYPATGSICNLLAGPPATKADVVLLLKTLPCLMQADKAAGRRLIDALTAPVVIVSFPSASLGGRKRGMPDFYANQFRMLMQGAAYDFEEISLREELVFRLYRCGKPG